MRCHPTPKEIIDNYNSDQNQEKEVKNETETWPLTFVVLNAQYVPQPIQIKMGMISLTDLN